METMDSNTSQRGRRLPARDRRETPEMLAAEAAAAAYRAARERVIWQGASGDGAWYQVGDRAFAPCMPWSRGST